MKVRLIIIVFGVFCLISTGNATTNKSETQTQQSSDHVSSTSGLPSEGTHADKLEGATNQEAGSHLKEGNNAKVEKGVVGYWKTIDDKTGEAQSIVKIFKEGQYLKGRIVHLIDPKGPNPTCKECQGEKKGQPIKGLEILWGLEKGDNGNEWENGKILDPNNGKTYSCQIELSEKGKELKVRGYIGVSLFGRTQTWHRQPQEQLPPLMNQQNNSEKRTSS